MTLHKCPRCDKILPYHREAFNGPYCTCPEPQTMTTNTTKLAFSRPPKNSIVYAYQNTEILRLTEDAFIFKGVEIKDAGEAHKAFLETMRTIQGGIKQ
jgi:hypothetical protein